MKSGFFHRRKLLIEEKGMAMKKAFVVDDGWDSRSSKVCISFDG